LYWRDFLSIAAASGFAEPRLVKDRPLAIENPEIQQRLAGYEFYSATYRLFKLETMEAGAEDYGHTARYLGTVDHYADGLLLDKGNYFPAGEEVAVSANTWRILSDSRFAPHFSLTGDFNLHRGPFDQKTAVLPFDVGSDDSSASRCC
jgi:hypothetical protein